MRAVGGQDRTGGDQQDRDPLVGQRGDEVVDLAGEYGCEAFCGFVQQQYAR